MFKKILPALTLMFVLTLSFAFRPAPQQHKQKTVDEVAYLWTGSDWESIDVEDAQDPDFCPLQNHLCAIVFDPAMGVSNAQSIALTAEGNGSLAGNNGEGSVFSGVTIYERQ